MFFVKEIKRIQLQMLVETQRHREQMLVETQRHREQMHTLSSFCKSHCALLVAKGWQRYEFESEYYGNHEELGQGHETKTFCFAPGVEIAQWSSMKFSHGSRGGDENYCLFHTWLEQLSPELYIEI